MGVLRVSDVPSLEGRLQLHQKLFYHLYWREHERVLTVRNRAS